MGATIEYEVADGIAKLTLVAPPMNAYDLDTLKQADARIVEARFDERVHVIVLTGAGEKSFCGGADIEMLRTATTSYRSSFCLYTHEFLQRLEHTPKLTVCAINGHCIGGGLEIALACDLRIARRGRLNLGFPEVNVGLLPGSGGTQRLPRLIGKGPALELMLRGKLIDVERAAQLGIVQELLDEETFAAKALAYAAEFAPPRKASGAAGRIKRAVQSGLEASLDEGLALERELIAQLFASDDAREGLEAFQAKRAPAFRGR
jgi:enoyl-CoA hydratase/carnithine racemase